jgi:cell volume regulation protein A
MPAPALPDPRLLGDFFVPGDVTLGSLAEIYGLPVKPADAATTLSDYFNHLLGHAPHEGDSLPLGAVALIAHTVADGRVVMVGLQLAEPESAEPTTRLTRAARALRRAAGRFKRNS